MIMYMIFSSKNQAHLKKDVTWTFKLLSKSDQIPYVKVAVNVKMFCKSINMYPDNLQLMYLQQQIHILVEAFDSC